MMALSTAAGSRLPFFVGFLGIGRTVVNRTRKSGFGPAGFHP